MPPQAYDNKPMPYLVYHISTLFFLVAVQQLFALWHVGLYAVVVEANRSETTLNGARRYDQ